MDHERPKNGTQLLEMMDDWSCDLVEALDEDLIIVEGKKDARALMGLGIPDRYVYLNRGMNIFDLVESIRTGSLEGLRSPLEGKLIILTDWDRTGDLLASRLERACTHLDVRSDLDFRRRISGMVGRWVKDIESIPAFLERVRNGDHLI